MTSIFDTIPDLREVRIVGLKRLNSTANGNPRFKLELDNGCTYQTQSDAACSYEITNFANSGEPFDVWLSRAGRISHIRKVPS